MTEALEPRVTRLEDILAQTLRTVDQTSREMREFKEEMREAHEASNREMREFKEEMREARETSNREMREFKEEMRNFKEEMRNFKEEMRLYREQVDAQLKRQNREWSDLAKKMGTLVEDLVAPSIPRIFSQLTGCPQDAVNQTTRFKRTYQKQNREFDVVTLCDNHVLITETKSNLRSEQMTEFAGEMLPQIRDFFPEYASRQFMGAMASLSVSPELIRYAFVMRTLRINRLRLWRTGDASP